MTRAPTDALHFRWPWRPYQQRLLANVDRHLRDGRLHIVAAPGAGKTTLGIEVFRRLQRPALVLAPTLTIRDQWIRRLADFLEDGESAPPWISIDLDVPAFLTATTYQAVLSRSRASATPTPEDVSTLIGTLRDAGVGTLILDEAHHLKRAWWGALERVVGGLPGLTLVSLTGTPPYDATGHEWRRYEQLCGPIDDEISTPELVKARTLCPHQDFVRAVAPRVEETLAVRAHDDAVAETLAELLDDTRFQQAIDGHPWLGHEPPIEGVLGDPELAVALLCYQRASGGGGAPELLAALDLDAASLPALDRRWWQVLLQEYLHGATFSREDQYRAALARTLRERGLLWRRSLRIERAPAVERALGLSGAKVAACVDVHRLERAVRREGLRQVFLLDYIRDETVGADGSDAGGAEQDTGGAKQDTGGVERDSGGAHPPDLGAWPVFRALTNASPCDPSRPAEPATDVGLLTGRLSVIHSSRIAALRAALGQDEVQVSPLPGRPEWLRLEGVRSGGMVAAFTKLLEDGALHVIVGTRSLLGEGWDAPVVNSVVLASYVGAFVSTNQMRGRAIRADPALKTKVASVWHLVAVQHDATAGFLDLDQLEARFRTFVGLSADGEVIGSGLRRLGLPGLRSAADLVAFNAEGERRLSRLPQVAIGWHQAIEGSSSGQVAPTVSFRTPPTLRPFYFAHTLRYVLLELAWSSLFALGAAVRGLSGSVGAAGGAVMVGAAIPMVFLAPKVVRAARLAFRHAPVDGSVRRIAQAVLDALRATGLVESGEGLAVRVERAPRGGVAVSLGEGSFYDQSLFADAMGEVLGPVQNARYLITRPARGLGGDALDFHAVPSVFGTRRELAEAFHAAWLRQVGVGDLIYTRKEGGRALLLRARARAFSNQFEDPAERFDRWQ